MAHGIQAAILGYFAANLFSFNNVPTYLISFLLVAYSFFLIRQRHQVHEHTDSPKPTIRVSPKRIAIVAILFILLILFIWNFNVRPFWIIGQLNIAEIATNNQGCNEAFALMDGLLETQHTYLDAYVISGYVNFIRNCARTLPPLPQQKIALAQKGYELLVKNITIRPSYTRNWVFLGGFTNTLIDAGQQELLNLPPSRLEELREEADMYFQEAIRRSPKRQDTYVEWIKTDLIAKDYETAIKKSQECIDLDPGFPSCWWMLARSQISLGNVPEAQVAVDEARSHGYKAESEASILQSLRVYIALTNLEAVADAYEKLVVLRPTNYQYRASLAFTYRELGQNDKARSEALKILELTANPVIQEDITQFLQTLE